MKNTMPYKTTNKFFLGNCYIFEKGEYVYHTTTPLKFPTVALKYKELLDELQIPYKVEVHPFTEDRLAYWSADHSEMVPVTLPLYAQTGDEYIYTGKSHTADQLQEDAERYAYEATLLINKHMAEFDNRMKQKAAEEELGEFWAAVEEKFNTCSSATSAFSMVFSFNADLNLEKDNYRNGNFIALPVFGGIARRTDDIVVFRTDMDLTGTFIRLKVPVGKEGIFVGRGGWQLKSWCRILGARKIIVSS